MENNVPQGMYPNVPQPPMQPPVQPLPNPGRPPMSGMAIAGLVLGIVAILISFVPIINNFAFILAILGIIFSIIGIVGTSKNKKSGKGMAIAALVINVLAFVIVLATQALFSAAFDSAMNGAQPAQSASTASQANQTATNSESNGASEDDYSNMPIGTAVELYSGLTITVNSVTEVYDHDGKSYSEVSVTYVNNGIEDESFGPSDWRGQNAQGAQRDGTFMIKRDGSSQYLDYGHLAPGGTVTDNVYFEGSITKVLYSSGMFSKASTASWVV